MYWKNKSISIDIFIMFMFFSSFEVIGLILGGKVMTFVLYPLLRSQGNVKNWNTTEYFAFEGVIVWPVPNNLGNCDSFTSAVISRICGAYLTVNLVIFAVD